LRERRRTMEKRDPRLEATYQMAQEILENLDHLSQASHKEKLRTIMEIIMRAERNLFLAQHPEDRANGYYQRSLNTASGPVPLSVPRDRAGQFRPQVLPPPYRRGDESYSHLLQALFSASYSPAKLRQVLKEMGLGYSQAEIDRLKEEILAEFHSWQSRELSSDWIAIFIDAYHTEVQEGGKVRKATLYSVLGINFQGEKELLGVYIAFGNENKDFWLQVLSELVRRGLKRVLVVISDDFGGLREAVATIYPQALHQLCFVHLQRNVRRNMAHKEAGEFLEELARIKLEKDYETALESFHRLLERFEEKYPSFIQRLRPFCIFPRRCGSISTPLMPWNLSTRFWRRCVPRWEVFSSPRKCSK